MIVDFLICAGLATIVYAIIVHQRQQHEINSELKETLDTMSSDIKDLLALQKRTTIGVAKMEREKKQEKIS